jgi:hypothetical protein
MGLSLSKNVCAKSDVVDQNLTQNGIVSKINDNIQKMQKSLCKEITITTENTDSVVFSIIEKIKSRADVGMEKYKTNLDRQDLSTVDWIIHAQEELMDAILYLEKLKQIESKKDVMLFELSNPAGVITDDSDDSTPSAPPSYLYNSKDEYFANFVAPPNVKETVKVRTNEPTVPILDLSDIIVNNLIDDVE